MRETGEPMSWWFGGILVVGGWVGSFLLSLFSFPFLSFSFLSFSKKRYQLVFVFELRRSFYRSERMRVSLLTEANQSEKKILHILTLTPKERHPGGKRTKAQRTTTLDKRTRTIFILASHVASLSTLSAGQRIGNCSRLCVIVRDHLCASLVA